MVDVLDAGDVMTAVFFEVAGNPYVEPVSALLHPAGDTYDATIHAFIIPSTDPDGNPSPDGGGDVGGEWAIGTGLDNPFPDGIGISSSGLDGGFDQFFGTVNLEGPGSGALDGPQYGIVSAFDDPDSYDAGRYTPLINDFVEFTVHTGGGYVFDENTINKTALFWGTGSPAPIPEADSLVLLCAGALVVGFAVRRKLA